MLVLTRRLMERFYIGDDICVVVVRLDGGQVRLGIEAPRHVPILRGELLSRQLTDAPPETRPVVDPPLRPRRVAVRGTGNRLHERSR